ncbi:MAG: sulfide/dihydroorotate dehydrogenase-like FAD/NAD-binding protein [Spirochaetales bacterium]|nr:sulfide/dihydroorotate dehydrogenase-like FAD/NAD-binding protein [Spirochaetales bacterium]
MNKIIEKKIFSGQIKLIVVEAPDVAAKAEPGQFIILRVSDKGERIPLTIADYDGNKGTLTLVFQEVGKSTIELGRKQPGDFLESLTGPLGMPSDIELYGKIICVGGGVGIAPIYPIARALKKAGNKVVSIIGARSGDLLFWEEKMKAVSDELIVCTDDGSYGRKALVTVPLKEILEREKNAISRIWAIGPAIMMKFCSATTLEFKTPTIVSLNSIMVDGTGMCGACRVEVGGQTRFVCVDGPEFDGHQVDWPLLMSRQKTYLEEEMEALEHYHNKSCQCDRS